MTVFINPFNSVTATFSLDLNVIVGYFGDVISAINAAGIIAVCSIVEMPLNTPSV